jgi:hypothetical protein
MNSGPPLTPLQIAQWFHRKGIVPLPVKGKVPTMENWPAFRPSKEDLAQHFNGKQQNIGALLGEASHGLVDVDLDWAEAEQLADAFLPSSWRFGRRNDADKFHLRHVLVRCPGLQTARWDAPLRVFAKPLRIVEVLSTGSQVVLPGSIHPDTGQPVEWAELPSKVMLATLPVDDLLERVNRLAGTALLVRLWPDLEGNRHDVALALAGSCHHAGWQHKDIATMAVALLTAAHDPETKDRARAVQDTLQAAAAGKPVTGFPRLAELLPAEVLAALLKWWGLGSEPQLTFGGKSASDVAAKAAAASQTDWAQAAWPELLPFAETLTSNREYPVDSLFPTMAAAVRDVVRVQQVPTALAAQSLLANTSAAAQPLFDAEIDGRRVPLSLWLVFIGNTGERKTSTDKLVRRQSDLRRREAKVRYQVERAAWLAMKKEGDPGPRPRQPSWLTTRGTVEGMLKMLDLHSPHTLFSTADAGSFFGGYSMREGRATASISVLSDLWSGESHTTVLASSDEASELHGRRLAVSLMLQPNIASDLFNTELLRGQGFLSRCLPALPPSRIGTRLYQPQGDTAGLAAYWAAVDKLLTQQASMDLEFGDLTSAPLPLTGAAHRTWVECHDEIETGMGSGGDYAEARAVANKMPEQALRLAGTITALEGRDAIDADAMQAGVQLMQYYLAEWLTLADKLHEHRSDVAEPQQLWDWLAKRRQEKGLHTFTLRDCYNAGPRFIRNKADHARALLNELIRRGYVRMTSGQTYEIRPADDC